MPHPDPDPDSDTDPDLDPDPSPDPDPDPATETDTDTNPGTGIETDKGIETESFYYKLTCYVIKTLPLVPPPSSQGNNVSEL